MRQADVRPGQFYTIRERIGSVPKLGTEGGGWSGWTVRSCVKVLAVKGGVALVERTVRRAIGRPLNVRWVAKIQHDLVMVRSLIEEGAGPAPPQDRPTAQSNEDNPRHRR